MKKIDLEKLSKENITRLIPICKNRKELLLKLGFNLNGGTKRTLRNICNKYGIDLSVFDTKLTPEKYYENPKYCQQCGKIIPYEKRINKFCSSSCAATYNNTGRVRIKKTDKKLSEKQQVSKEKHYCLFCGKELTKYHQEKFCSQKCQLEQTHKKFIERWKNGDESGLKGEYGISSHIRRYLFEKYNNKCQCCGWGEINQYTGKYPLEIHHIDGDYTNNKEENLQLLCPNCHSLTETYKAHNKKGRKGRDKYNKTTNK